MFKIAYGWPGVMRRWVGLHDAKKESLKVLEQVPDNDDALLALVEAARTREEIEAAKEQLGGNFRGKERRSFGLRFLLNLFLNTGNLIGAANTLLQQALTLDPLDLRQPT